MTGNGFPGVRNETGLVAEDLLDRLVREADVEVLRLESALERLAACSPEARAISVALSSCATIKDLLECSTVLSHPLNDGETACLRTPFRVREVLEGAEGLLRLRQGFGADAVRTVCDRALDTAEILGDPRELERVIYMLAREASCERELLPVRIEARLAGRGADRLMTEFRISSKIEPLGGSVQRLSPGIDRPSLALDYCRQTLLRRNAELVVEEVSGEGLAFRFLLDSRIVARNKQ